MRTAGGRTHRPNSLCGNFAPMQAGARWRRFFSDVVTSFMISSTLSHRVWAAAKMSWRVKEPVSVAMEGSASFAIITRFDFREEASVDEMQQVEYEMESKAYLLQECVPLAVAGRWSNVFLM